MATQHSSGRGGAGNVTSKPSPKVTATQPRGSPPPGSESLETPTIKQSTFTTGRGGAGNMAENTSAASTRAAQDVSTPEAHNREMKGTYHWGRGGEGNMVTLEGKNGKADEGKRKGSVAGKDLGEAEAKEGQSGGAGARARRKSSNVLERGKEMLGLSKEAKEREKNGSAVAVDD